MTTIESSARRTYDDLAGIVDRWRTLDAENPIDDCSAATTLLATEARLLDDRRFDAWIDQWSADGALWVPLDPDRRPDEDQSFYLDDLRRLRERVDWLGRASAWSQHPVPRTVRSVSNVEALMPTTGRLEVRSTVTISEIRASRVHHWNGHQFHVFERSNDRWQRRYKILCVPELRREVPHPGVLL